jgi:hypothetical protein
MINKNHLILKIVHDLIIKNTRFYQTKTLSPPNPHQQKNDE